jgi:diguanylate cyclase (GGDEF)-like protein
LNDLDGADRTAAAILRELAEPFELGVASVQISASIGIAYYAHDGSGIEALLANADQAMYEAKRQGRNRYCCFHEAAPAADGSTPPPDPA